MTDIGRAKPYGKKKSGSWQLAGFLTRAECGSRKNVLSNTAPHKYASADAGPGRPRCERHYEAAPVWFFLAFTTLTGSRAMNPCKKNAPQILDLKGLIDICFDRRSERNIVIHI